MSGERQAAFLEPAIVQVMETMYFCTPLYCGSASLTGALLGASLPFRELPSLVETNSELSGELRVVMNEELARRMASDFLPADPEDVTHEQMDGTIREFTNIACGAALAKWMPKAEFQFGIPRKMDPEQNNGLSGHCFLVPGGFADEAMPSLSIIFALESDA